MLREYNGVDIAMDIEDIALKVLDIAGNEVILIAFGVFLRGIHIAFAIHCLVIFPVDHGASRYCRGEGTRMAIHEGGGKEATEAPSIDSQTIGIDIGEGLEVFHTGHLVFHRIGSQVAVDHTLEGEASVLGTAIVQGEDKVLLILGQGEHPRVGGSIPLIDN